MSDRTNAINEKFASQTLDSCESALGDIAGLSNLSSDEKIELATGISTIFYRDEVGDTSLFKLLKKAEEVMGSLGPDVADWLISQFDEADAETAEHLAKALAWIGADAIDKIIAAFESNKDDSYTLISLLASIGSFRDPSVVKALPQAFQETESSDPQVQSAAIYSLGRLANRISVGDINNDNRTQMFDKCFSGLASPKALVRRHAVRAIGKMIKNSFLTDVQVGKADKAFRAILGTQEFEWDDAYIVRNEAQHFLHYLNQS